MKNPVRYLKQLLLAITAIVPFFTLLSASSIEDHESYIALHAPYSSSDVHPYASIINLSENMSLNPAQVLLEAVWYSGATHTTQKLGSLLLSEIKSGQRFLWDNPCTSECAGEYRIYAYCVKPGTHHIIKQISPISDIITITMSPHDQIGDTPSYAPFFLQLPQKISPKKNSSNTVPLIIAGIGTLLLGATALTVYKRFFKDKKLPENKKNNTQNSTNIQHNFKPPLHQRSTVIIPVEITKRVLDYFAIAENKQALDNFIQDDLLHHIYCKHNGVDYLAWVSLYESSGLQDIDLDPSAPVSADDLNIILIGTTVDHDSQHIQHIKDFIKNSITILAASKWPATQEATLTHQQCLLMSLYEVDKNSPKYDSAQRELVILKTIYIRGYQALHETNSLLCHERLDPNSQTKRWGTQSPLSMQDIFGNAAPLALNPLRHLLDNTLTPDDKDLISSFDINNSSYYEHNNISDFLKLIRINTLLNSKKLDQPLETDNENYKQLSQAEQKIINHMNAQIKEMREEGYVQSIYNPSDTRNFLEGCSLLLINLHKFINNPSSQKEKEQAEAEYGLLCNHYITSYNTLLKQDSLSADDIKKFDPTTLINPKQNLQVPVTPTPATILTPLNIYDEFLVLRDPTYGRYSEDYNNLIKNHDARNFIDWRQVTEGCSKIRANPAMYSKELVKAAERIVKRDQKINQDLTTQYYTAAQWVDRNPIPQGIAKLLAHKVLILNLNMFLQHPPLSTTKFDKQVAAQELQTVFALYEQGYNNMINNAPKEQSLTKNQIAKFNPETLKSQLSCLNIPQHPSPIAPAPTPFPLVLPNLTEVGNYNNLITTHNAHDFVTWRFITEAQNKVLHHPKKYDTQARESMQRTAQNNKPVHDDLNTQYYTAANWEDNASVVTNLNQAARKLRTQQKLMLNLNNYIDQEAASTYKTIATQELPKLFEVYDQGFKNIINNTPKNKEFELEHLQDEFNPATFKKQLNNLGIPPKALG